MRRTPRGLSPDEAMLWARLAATVKPMVGRKNPSLLGEVSGQTDDEVGVIKATLRPTAPPPSTTSRLPPPPRGEDRKKGPPPLENRTLDASWDRNLARGTVSPDFTIDLHETTLDGAHGRLEHGLTLAAAQGARVVLVITGRARPVAAADRGSQRGAIRAKFLDWLALGSHAGRIAAVRGAHPKHGGAGAVYVVLRRVR